MAGIHSALSAVDKATPQQLKMMLDDPANPYRALALMKLQEYRNAKMQATQPPAPPLAQTIPQQVEGGIPQAMPQAMPPQMAGGGIIAFKDGGDIQRYAGNEESLIEQDPLRGSYYERATSPRAEISPRFESFLESIGKYPKIAADKLGSGIADMLLSPTTNYNDPNAFVNSRSAPSQSPLPASTSGIKTPINMTGNEPEFAIKGAPSTAPVPRTALPESATKASPGGIGSLPHEMPGLSKARGAIDTAFKELRTGREGERRAMEDAMRAREGDAAARQKALGTEEERKAAVISQMKDLDVLLPDQNKRIAAEIEKMRADTEKDSASAPYQGLLKMAVSMMSTNKTNFLQAVGEAGGAGLEEFNKLKTAVNARKSALLSADASLAAAQEARQRGLYDQAKKDVELATQKRMDAWNFERDASVLQGQMAIQLAAHKTGDSEAKVKEAQTLFAIDQAGLDYTLKLKELAQRGSAAAAAMIPNAAKEIMWLKAHPEHVAEFQTRSDHMTYLSLVDDAMKNLTSRQAAAERSGIMPGSPEYPTPDKVRKEIIDNITQGRRIFGTTSRPEIR